MNRAYRVLHRLRVRPWRSDRIPDALARAIAAMPPGRAVDLGGGTGEQARHLAAHGWSVDSIDIAPAAIADARRADLDSRVRWLVADVTEPAAAGMIGSGVTLLLDNGCLHGIPPRRRSGWADTVRTVAAPGATLLVRASPPGRGRLGPRGIARHEIDALLSPDWLSHGEPQPGWHAYARAPGRSSGAR